MLTRKQHELLMFIHERIKESGVSPSFDEMKEALDLAITEQLAATAPPGALLVTESGIFTPADAARLERSGARAMLVGESLMRQADVTTATRALLAA